MKPLKVVPWKHFNTFDGTYVYIEYKTSYSHGTYIIALDLYTEHQKKFDKLLKDCQIIKFETKGK